MFRSTVVLAALVVVFSSCGKDAAPAGSVKSDGAKVVGPGNSLNPLSPPAQANPPASVDGVVAFVITPEKQTGFLQHTPDANRDVPSKTFNLADFKRTIEDTDLAVSVKINKPSAHAGAVKAVLMQAGKKEASDSATLTAQGVAELKFKFKSPKLSRAEKDAGFKTVSAEVQLTFADGKTGRLPFSYSDYDSSQPTFVEAEANQCVIYNVPERASGCYQNRTRSTQEVVFNDSVTQHHEVDVSFSGGLQLAFSIVTLSLGIDTTIANGTDTSRGSEIHFTNCIECASLIYRQEVETIRKADIYQVRADGSLTWSGDATVKQKQVAYEFASTPSESQDYGCDIPSQLPTGTSPDCTPILNGGH